MNGISAFIKEAPGKALVMNYVSTLHLDFRPPEL